MRILGIDPGIATVGFGVVDSEGPRQSFVRCGVITTPAGTALSSRLERIYSDMGELISTFKPDDAADAVAIALCHARSATSLMGRQAEVNRCTTI